MNSTLEDNTKIQLKFSVLFIQEMHNLSTKIYKFSIFFWFLCVKQYKSSLKMSVEDFSKDLSKNSERWKTITFFLILYFYPEDGLLIQQET